MSLLVRLSTRDGDILHLGVVADQLTVAIISQGRNPGKSPCEKSCCWLSICYMLRLSRTGPRVFFSKCFFQRIHFYHAILIMVQSYLYEYDRFLFSDNLPSELCCSTLIRHKSTPLREASRKECTQSNTFPCITHGTCHFYENI